MSAAAQPQPIYPEPFDCPKIKAACFAPVSFFEGLLDLGNYADLKCFCLVMVETLGADRKEAEISIQRFSDTARISKDYVYECLDRLEKSGLIQRRCVDDNPDDDRRTFYAIAQRYIRESKGAGKEKIHGTCPHCHVVGDFSTSFIPTPHSAFRKLTAGLTSAAFRCLMVIVRYSLKWNTQLKCIRVEPYELDINDFERFTNLEHRMITAALSELNQAGLIGRQQRLGRTGFFWALPDAFLEVQARQKRTVQRDEKAKPAQPKVEEIQPKVEEPEATESGNRDGAFLYARCEACHHFVYVEPAIEQELPVSKVERPARAGPHRETVSPTEERRQKSRRNVLKLAELFESLEKKLG